MAQRINNPYEFVNVVKKPAIELASRHIVSRTSENSLRPVESVRFAAALQQPLQTGDLAIVVRDELEESPLIENGEKTLDDSNFCQRLSDIALFYQHHGDLAIAVSDLPTMYRKDWDAQIAAAEKIAWGIYLPMKDELVQRILEAAGKRKAPIYTTHWPYSAPSAILCENRIALAFFPNEARRNGKYLVRHGRSHFDFYLIGPETPKILNSNETGLVLPCSLGGVDNYVDSSYILTAGVFSGIRRARAGSYNRDE